MTDQTIYHRRHAVLRHRLKDDHLDGFLVSHMPNVRYLCGFTGSNGILAIAGKRIAFLTDGRYTTQARQQVQQAKVLIPKKPLFAAALEWIAAQNGTHIGIEGDYLTLTMQSRLVAAGRELQKKVKLKATSGFIEQIRMLKEPQEIEQIRASVLLASCIFETGIRLLKPGMRESDFAAELEYLARRSGAEAMSFPTLIASGERSALPHGLASVQPIAANGFVIIDFGVILGGYCSDMTRTVYVGKPTARAKYLYEAVLEAQLAAIAMVKPGRTAGEIDRAARKVLRKAKLAKYFSHSTGHGVGLEIHEPPRIGKDQEEVLRAGNIITIEPGVYVPNEGGVRIEDILVVVEGGCEVLTPTSKELMVV